MRPRLIIALLSLAGCNYVADGPVLDPTEPHVCTSSEIRLEIAEPESSAGQTPPQCTGAEDVRLMSYQMSCNPQNGPWSICRYGADIDLRAFDAGGGYLAVEFEALSTVTRGLNLWYGPYPNRRRLPLKDPELELPPGEYVRYLHAKDSCTDSFVCPWCSNNEACPLPEEAITGADITIAGEDCSIGQATGMIALKSVSYHPADCKCVSDAECAAPATSCRVLAGGPLPDRRCPGGQPCAGLCTVPEADCGDGSWIGQPCTLSSADAGLTCMGRLACVRGAPACVADGC